VRDDCQIETGIRSVAISDLTARRESIVPHHIEALISPYVTYVVDAGEIFFGPSFYTLTNSSKILVFLTAVRGWEFIDKDEIHRKIGYSAIAGATGLPIILVMLLMIFKIPGAWIFRDQKLGLRIADSHIQSIRAHVTSRTFRRSVRHSRKRRARLPWSVY
jgi:hypothetical protein